MPLVALLSHGKEMFATRLDEAHRTIERASQERHEDVFGIDNALGTEPAADVLCHHAHGMLGEPEEASQEPAEDLGRLCRRPHRHLAERSVPAGGDPPRLEGHAGAAVQREPLAHDHIGPGQGARGIAHALSEAGRDVSLAMHAWPVGLERGVQRRDGGERIVLHPERGESVLRLGRALGHHEDHWLTDVGDDLLRQDLRTHGSQQARMRNKEGEPPERRHVGRHEHVHDPRGSPCRLGVDPHESRVSMHASVDSDVEHPGERHVGDVPAAPRDQPRVLAAAHVRPEEPLAHEVIPTSGVMVVSLRLDPTPSGPGPARATTISPSQDDYRVLWLNILCAVAREAS